MNIDYSKPECQAIACEKRGNLIRFMPWDKDDEESAKYYCVNHYYEELELDRKQLQIILDYYKDEKNREWLSPDLLELYNKYAKK